MQANGDIDLVLKQSESSISPREMWPKGLLVLVSALLFGFGWHIRGSGTSDPAVVMLLFLLFVGVFFGPRQMHGYFLFGLVVLIFRALRRGWGTFVGQAGIPGLFDGQLISYVENYEVAVAWWQGYFWLFFVGLAWAGPAALLIGGYFFTEKQYGVRDGLFMGLLYAGGLLVGRLITAALIPIISPEAYYDIYATGISERNYISMMDNMSMSFAMVPVLLYILIARKDRRFALYTTIVMLIFGFAFAAADIWQVIGRNNLAPAGFPFWSMWEYFSGFIVGSLLAAFYLKIPKVQWDGADHEIPVPEKPWLRFLLLYGLGHAALFLYGFQESLVGAINSTAGALGVDLDLSTVHGIIIVLAIDLPLFLLFWTDRIHLKFQERPFHEKCLLLLIVLLPVYYFFYAAQHIVTGNLFTADIRMLVAWIDTLSVLVTEIFLVITWRRYERGHGVGTGTTSASISATTRSTGQ